MATTRSIRAEPDALPHPSAHLVAVAYSGGRDSTALLHATLNEAASGGNFRVIALHVHHGLQPQADAWLAHCERQCAQWEADGLPVTFAAHRLTTHPAPGDSVEAWARRERYAALRDLARAHTADVVLLGHHRRDQAETWLLQALRGAGAAGLAAMPRTIERDGVVWLRPWLRRSRECIDAYVRQHRLAHVDDDSNADPRFARNRLRLGVWPALAAAFPQAEATLAQAARWSGEALAALDELAAIDKAAVVRDGALLLPSWLGLSLPRRSLCLRAWLNEAATGRPVPAALVERLMAELPMSRGGARWHFGEFDLTRVRGRLVMRPAAALPPRASTPPEPTLGVHRAGLYALPGWGGRLRVMRVKAGGLSFDALTRLELRARAGGERFQPAADRPPRSLKKQFQAAEVSACSRTGPLVYSGGRLVFVPGLGVDARALAPAGEAQAMLEWLPMTRGDGAAAINQADPADTADMADTADRPEP